MMHVVTLDQVGGRDLPICSCGDRPTHFPLTRQVAEEWALDHERRGRMGVLSLGKRQPSPDTLVRIYREKAEQQTYAEEERTQFLSLAQEIEDTLGPKHAGPIEGQMGLFD